MGTKGLKKPVGSEGLAREEGNEGLIGIRRIE